MTDTISPVLKFTSAPLQFGLKSGVKFEGTIDDTTATMYVSVDSSNVAPVVVKSDGTWQSFLPLSSGVHRISYIATDPFGNQSSLPTLTIDVDGDRPQITSAKVVENGSSVTISGVATDFSNSISGYVTEGATTLTYIPELRSAASFSARMELSFGHHVLTLHAIDKYGNEATFDLEANVSTTGFGEVTTDPHSIGGQVYALYDGLLGRAPDTLGLEYWADAFRDGVAPKTLAAGFLAPPEGQARAGSADNATFVTQLYDATLHRSPDAAGLAYWTDQLAHGASRADVGVGFALSSEHLANIQPALDAGLFVPDADAAAVARVYYTMLSRAPDAAGLKFWTDAIKAGTPLAAETQSFLNSPESQLKVVGLTTAHYVDLVYTNALGRHAEADGLAFWTSAIDTHVASRVDVTTQIGQSTEAQAHLAPLIEQGWHLA